MEVAKPIKNLDAVLFYDSNLCNFIFFYVRAQGASSDHLCNKNDLLLIFVLPTVYKVQDIFVLQIFYQVDLWLDPISIVFRQTDQTNHIPGDFSACLVIKSFVYNLIRAFAKLLVKSDKSTFWRYFCNVIVYIILVIWFIFFLRFFLLRLVFRFNLRRFFNRCIRCYASWSRNLLLESSRGNIDKSDNLLFN